MNKAVKIAGAVVAGVALGIAAFSWYVFRPPGGTGRPGVFAVPEQREGLDVAQKLEQQGFIRNAAAFRLLLWLAARDREIAPGGYRLDQAMNAWVVMKTLTAEPALLWLTTSGCLRREQVGEVIAARLGWNGDQMTQWNNLYAEDKPEWAEGVYFPDTYLLPKDEPVEAVARRFIDNFNAKFSPLLGDFVKQNITWTTGLTIASLIQREAAGPEDMKLVSGIIWNRLNGAMKLEIDATMQYTRGKKPDGSWWGAVDLAEKRSDSPYNTYRRRGLPPSPICSPGIEAIRAVLVPEMTDCLFYLHDRNRQIHCAITYFQHIKNIRTYLR